MSKNQVISTFVNSQQINKVMANKDEKFEGLMIERTSQLLPAKNY